MIPCGSCNASCIGETGRSVEESRYADHLRGQSALHSHFNECQHTSPGIHNVKVLCKESNDIKRKIKEALYIKVNDPVLNRNIGKYTIPDSYDKLLKEKGGLHVSKTIVPKVKIKRIVNNTLQDGIMVSRSEFAIVD